MTTATTSAQSSTGTSVEDYMRRPYVMEIVWDEDYWAATFPELPGLVAAADSWEELQQKIHDAKWSYFEAALDAGLPIAEPGEGGEPASGRVLLRLPKSQHRQAARAAARDAVSVNTFLVAAIAKELGRREVTQQGSPRTSPMYDVFAREPVAWRTSALQLKRAADAVAVQWEQDLYPPSPRSNPAAIPPSLGPVYMLLAAYAVETIAKAILFNRDRNRLLLDKHTLYHYVVTSIGGSWTSDDKTLLRRLETFAVWSGRYPAPLKPEKFVPVKGEDTPVLYADGTVVAGPDGEPEMIEGHLHLPDVATTRDISDVNRLFDRLLGLLDTEPAVASATLPPSPI